MNWKWDISILRHFVEALAFSIILAFFYQWVGNLEGTFSLFAWTVTFVSYHWAYQYGFLLAAIIMFCIYVGREKRDCETGWHDDKGNKMKSGDLRAWYRMWIRPKNILDMLGPFVVMAFAIWNYIYN